MFSVASNYPKSHLSAPSLFSDTAQTVLVGLLFSMVAGNVPSGAQRQIESYLVAFRPDPEEIGAIDPITPSSDAGELRRCANQTPGRVLSAQEQLDPSRFRAWIEYDPNSLCDRQGLWAK